MRFTLMFLFISVSLVAIAQSTWKKTREELIVKDPPFKQCHASTVVEYAKNKLMAAWFGGSNEGNKDVVIWISRNENGKWTKPIIVANGVVNDSLRYPCWNPVLFKDMSNTLHLYYKVGPNPREWWGMETKSTDNGHTWSLPVRLPPGILGPIKNKPLQLADSTILSPSSTETATKWSVHIERSTDGGKSWQLIPIDVTGSFEVIQPALVQYADGRIQLLCRSKQGRVIQAWSSNKGQSWSKLSPTSLLNPNSGIDAATLKDGSQLIVYNPDLPGKEWYNGRAKLHVAISKDGATWKDIAILENGTREEFSYPAVIESSDGAVHITYTYDRKNIKYVKLERVKR